MSVFNFEEEENKSPQRGKSKFFWFFAGCVAMATLGTSLAAQINLNNNGNVEFGQGVLQTSTCDSNGILVTPINSFANESRGGTFLFNAIQITKIASTCSGKDFLIRVYDGEGDLISLTEGDSGNVYSARIQFNSLAEEVLVGGQDSGSNTVSEYGYWADQFTLSENVPILVGTLNNLVKKDSVGEPVIGESAKDYFEFDSGDNGFQISFNPSSQIAEGFANSRNVYRITLETVSRQG